ncbi:MAG: hypothetical protein M3Y59_21930 [Myxococcota bacterium]|nr:hypothetical protein [Myxococcota bacterium]
MFTGVKVFSATKAKEREELGENVTRWLKSNSDLELVDRVVRQSSDNEFHCYTLILFYNHPPKPAAAPAPAP